MKKINILRIITITFLNIALLISCSKDILPTSTSRNKSLNNVVPAVPYCGEGYQWDYYLGKCVPICPSGYHNDSITGACVENGSSSIDTLTVVVNNNNPQEAVGQSHNNGMYAIMPYYANGALQPTEQNVTAYKYSFLASQNYNITLLESIDSCTNHYLGDIYLDTSVTATANTIYQDGFISSTAENYLIQLNSFISNFGSDNYIIPTQSAYNSFANSLITYENQINSNSSLSSNEKNILLAAYSVARYSPIYAINYSITQSSSQQYATISLQSTKTSTIQPLKAASTPWFSWKSVVGDDVAGAIGGALGGGAVALATGGALAPAIGAGALSVGVGSSGYGAAKQIWNHFFGS